MNTEIKYKILRIKAVFPVRHPILEIQVPVVKAGGYVTALVGSISPFMEFYCLCFKTGEKERL